MPGRCDRSPRPPMSLPIRRRDGCCRAAISEHCSIDSAIGSPTRSSIVRRSFERSADDGADVNDRDEGPAWRAGTYIAPWEDEFQAFIFGWVVPMGFTDWEAIFRWKIGSTIARTDGKSGWIRARPVPYRMMLREHAGESPWCRSWAECWMLNAARQNLTYVDPNHLPVAGDITYPIYARGGLAIADALGVKDAKPCFEWLDQEIRGRMRGNTGLDVQMVHRIRRLMAQAGSPPHIARPAAPPTANRTCSGGPVSRMPSWHSSC